MNKGIKPGDPVKVYCYWDDQFTEVVCLGAPRETTEQERDDYGNYPQIMKVSSKPGIKPGFKELYVGYVDRPGAGYWEFTDGAISNIIFEAI